MTTPISQLSLWLTPSLLATIRIAPTFLFAPPFTLTRIPRLVRLWFAMGFAFWLVSVNPADTALSELTLGQLFAAVLGEAMFALVPVVALQFLYGMLYVAGRTIDVQSGYGLALIIDPTTRGLTPLVGTLLAYLGGITFFAVDGTGALLRFFSASLGAAPLGSTLSHGGIAQLSAFVFTISIIALGVAGAAILVLLLTDTLLALLARTVPQMNALLLGIQVKAILLLVLLPFIFSLSGVLMARMAAVTLLAIPRLI
jgi:flagellar biosynthesis protein FliR